MKKILIACLLYLTTLPVLAQNTILIVGDSISAAYGIEVKHGWVALLQQQLQAKHYPYQVINASISGDTTSDGLARMPNALKQYHPTIVIIELGGNDGLRGLQTTVIAANLHQMIQLALAAKTKVLVLGVRISPNYGEAYTQQFQQVYLDLAKRKDIHVIPLFLNGIDANPERMQADGIHPAENAQQQLLNNAWVGLEKIL